MKRILFAAAAAGLMAPFALPVAAMADPGDHWKKQWEKRADCEKKLAEAKSARDFTKKLGECNRELAKLDREQRKEAVTVLVQTSSSLGTYKPQRPLPLCAPIVAGCAPHTQFFPGRVRMLARRPRSDRPLGY